VLSATPTATLQGPADGVRGQVRTFTFAATSPSAAEQAAGREQTGDAPVAGESRLGPATDRDLQRDARVARVERRDRRRGHERVAEAARLDDEQATRRPARWQRPPEEQARPQ
jgi:hypothetical protein